MNFPPMRALKIITGHVIYNPTYTYKFQVKITKEFYFLGLFHLRNGTTKVLDPKLLCKCGNCTTMILLQRHQNPL